VSNVRDGKVNKRTIGMPGDRTERFHQNTLLGVSILLALMLAATIGLTIRSNNRLAAILEESVKSELIATCVAARNNIDMELFMAINSQEDFDAHKEEIDATIERLRSLGNDVGATYIYALKFIDGECYFIFDTDEEVNEVDNPLFDTYEIAEVHEKAFAGEQSSGIINVSDEWGNYNTGAIPLYHQGDVVGVVSVDFEDTYIKQSRETSAFDAALLALVLLVTMALLLGLLVVLLRRNRQMQDNLFYVANHDGVTELYNRYYLFSYFSRWSKLPHSQGVSFIFLFIDLDNFKRVNDTAGHDDGDKLLQLIAQFLKTYTDAHQGNEDDIQSMTARIGGDEFVQIVPGIVTVEEAGQWAQTLLTDFAADPQLRPFIERFGVGLSIGGALFPTQTTDYTELMRFADIAMYQAKDSGKGNYRLYDESMGDGPENVTLSVRRDKRQGEENTD
jgi:diguanylate cyclase (GGDEF)-like protein